MLRAISLFKLTQAASQLRGFQVMVGSLFAAILLVNCSHQTNDVHLPDIENRIQEAQQLLLEDGPELALPEFRRILDVSENTGDEATKARALGYIGVCYRESGELRTALEYQEKALALKRALGDKLEEAKTLGNIGLVYWELAEYGSATLSLNAALEIAQGLGAKSIEAALRNNIGLVFDELGDYRSSLQQYQQALQIHREEGDRGRESATLGNIGGVHLLLGRYQLGLDRYREALAISKELRLKPSACIDLGNIAQCYLGLGKGEQSHRAFDEALALARELGLRREEADWTRGKGELLFRQGRYAESITEYSKALETYEDAGLKREAVETLSLMGSIFRTLGDLRLAEENLQRALQTAEAIKLPRGVIMILLSLGDLRCDQAFFEEAELLYNRALEVSRGIEDQANEGECLIHLAALSDARGNHTYSLQMSRRALSIAETIGSPLAEIEAHYRIAEAKRLGGESKGAISHYEKGRLGNSELEDPELGWRLAWGLGKAFERLNKLEDALKAYEEAIENIESVRFQLSAERYGVGYMDQRYEPYLDLVRLLTQQEDLGSAFHYSERLRAKSYLDSLAQNPPIRDRAQRERETQLRQQIEALRRSLTQEGKRTLEKQRRAALSSFQEELRTAERAYHDFLGDLYQTEPRNAKVRQLTAPDLEDVQRALTSEEVLIEYLVTEVEVIVFVLRRDQIEVLQLAEGRQQLRSRVELLRDLIERQTDDDWAIAGRSLHEILIAPLDERGLLDATSLLTIVPHDLLHHLPFTALVRSGEDEIRYLVQDFVIRTVPSASLLLEKPHADLPRYDLLLVAPESSNLKFAQHEVEAIAKLFESGAQVLSGSEATELEFVNRAGSYGRIHLATHGVFDPENPLLSCLQLEPDVEEDGRLQVHEILELDLRAESVVLSACESGLGSGYFVETPVSDDLIGLVRAFLYAGSQSVIASLWKLDDRCTADLMTVFYRSLHDRSPAEALALAQRSMLDRDEASRHPYFWAPFVFVGQMKSEN